MNAVFIRDEVIKSKLIDMFGRTMAEEIYQEAVAAAARAQGDAERLKIFVEQTCADPRFIGMWGTAQAARQQKEWLGLLS